MTLKERWGALMCFLGFHDYTWKSRTRDGFETHRIGTCKRCEHQHTEILG